MTISKDKTAYIKIMTTDSMTCELFEIKHSNQIAKSQYRHLNDEEKLKQTEHEFGTISKRMVLYRGKNQSVEGVFYRNAVEYLEELKA